MSDSSSRSKFFIQDPGIRRNTTWYYCPRAFSEYKLDYLDVALKEGILTYMKPPTDLDGGFADDLFTGALPSTSDHFKLRSSFLHYLHSLHAQVSRLDNFSYDRMFADQSNCLDSAELLLAELRRKGIFGEDRDFSDIIDVNRKALIHMEETRGPILRHRWDNLH